MLLVTDESVSHRNYDVFQSSSTPGPNAPLGNLCGTSSQPQYSAEAAFAQWTAAGFPANKLVLGLPLYGYVSQSTKTVLQDSVILPGKGFAKGEIQERGGPACALPAQPPSTLVSPPHAVGPSRGANKRPKNVKNLQVESAGDLSSYYGQEIPFNQIVALGALKKSGSVYVQANGYTEGSSVVLVAHSFVSPIFTPHYQDGITAAILLTSSIKLATQL